ncbi:spermidine synthase [Opitutales bacterium ASA1]|uniref:spermine/spermidine synthase domain-containing protein n=1 Tax=Congregicoccus parvus TaxID=3081749 RepID=UPI002B286276|nr:spermidine synthase [Opitutales bacterium ASA1]
MKPTLTLAETITPDGMKLVLQKHDDAYLVRLAGQTLMHSHASASEHKLGEVAIAPFAGKPGARVLVGGLGLGFTLQALLTWAARDARVQVVELFSEIVSWNREYLGTLNGARLEDPRVEVRVDDLWEVLVRAPEGAFDSIVLDVDNGPVAMVYKGNARLYKTAGIKRLHAALAPGGRAAIWSAADHAPYADALRAVGFRVEVLKAKPYAGAKRDTHRIFVADKPLEGFA